MSLSNIPGLFGVHDVSKLSAKGTLAFQCSPSMICSCFDDSLVVLAAYPGSEDHVIKVFQVFNSTHDK